MNTPVQLLPLAITVVDGQSACVAGVGPDGTWLRPELVHPAEVAGADPVYQFFRPVEVELGPAAEEAPRLEDRSCHGIRLIGSEVLPRTERAELIRRLLSPGVIAAFATGRSAALVRVRIEGLERRRSLGRRTALRLTFCDSTGERFDWRVLDVRLAQQAGEAVFVTPPETEAVLAITLTRPNPSFPGRFGGCHPIVAGIHGPDGGYPGWLPSVENDQGV